MGNLSSYVTITVSRSSAGLTRAGYGTALILTPNVAWVERTRVYSNIDAVAVDFTNTKSAEYRAASALFAQSPAPKRVKFGRLANKPTQVYAGAIAAVRDSHAYSVYVTCTAFDRQIATFTSGVGTTNDLIVAGLVAAINALTSNTYLAAVVALGGDTDTFTVTADAAGGWLAIEPADVLDVTVAQTHADPGAAADLTAIKLADGDFYAIHNPWNSSAMATAIAAWTETAKKFFMFDSNATQTILLADGGGDVFFDAMQTAAYNRTACIYHHRPDQMIGCAWLGKVFPLDPGSETWADKPLSGVDATNLSDTQRANLVAKNANGYEAVGSQGITFQGMMASGEWIDAIRFLDWFENTAATRIFNMKINSAKVPFTNPGLAKIESELRGACLEGERAGGIKAGWTVVMPDADDEIQVTAANRTARTVNNCYANFQLAGAVHIVNVRANVIP